MLILNLALDRPRFINAFDLRELVPQIIASRRAPYHTILWLPLSVDSNALTRDLCRLARGTMARMACAFQNLSPSIIAGGVYVYAENASTRQTVNKPTRRVVNKSRLLLALRLSPVRQIPGPERPRCLACCWRAHRRGLCRLWLGDGSASAGDAREWPGRTCWRGCDHRHTVFPCAGAPDPHGPPRNRLANLFCCTEQRPVLASTRSHIRCCQNHCCLRHNTFSSHPLRALSLALDSGIRQHRGTRIICVHSTGCWCAVLIE